jgi:hypothetical protein
MYSSELGNVDQRCHAVATLRAKSIWALAIICKSWHDFATSYRGASMGQHIPGEDDVVDR